MRIKLIMIVVFFILSAILNVKAEIIEKVVAVVNNEIITLSELNGVVKPIILDNKVKFEGEEGKRKLNELKKNVLNEMIASKLISQEAKQRNIEVSKGEIENALKDAKNRFSTESEFELALKVQGMTLDRLKERIKDQIMGQKLINQEVYSKILVDEAEIEEFYKKHIEEFKEPDKIRVSHILIKFKGDEQESLNNIKDIFNKLQAGASFSELAKKFSEDESTKENYGNLGIIKRGDMVKEFEASAFSLKEGEFSDIVKTPLGYHIIKLEARIPGRYYSLTDEVPETQDSKFAKKKIIIKDIIKYELTDNKTRQKLEGFINELKSRAVIEKDNAYE